MVVFDSLCILIALSLTASQEALYFTINLCVAIVYCLLDEGTPQAEASGPWPQGR